MAAGVSGCIFCQIATSSTSTTLLHSVNSSSFTSFSFFFFRLITPFPLSSLSFSRSPFLQDEKVVAFQDINPSALRHYLVISKEHIPTVKDLQKRQDDYTLVSHMLDVGKSLLRRDAPQSKQYRFGFHQPPLNSVNHLHLHCLALPYTPSWRCIKYTSLGPLGGFIEAEKLLQRLKL